jgi:ABC-2 type transport system permease protein
MTTMTSALRAEWTKLRSVRSTPSSLVVLLGLTVALGAVACSGTDTEGGSPSHPGDENVVMTSLVGVYFGQIAAVAFGVLAICSEFATGTIRATFAANPRRRQVLVAKVAIVGALVLVAGAVATLVSFQVGQPILRSNGFVYDNGYPAVSLADGEALRTVAIATGYLVVLALLSLGVAAVVRHTATAISVLLGLLFLPWIVGELLPEGLGEALQKATPMVGLAAQERGAPIGPWAGIGVTAAWAAAAFVVALWLVRRRDA